MCLILDSNQWGDFVKNKTDMRPVHQWLDGGGKLVYSDHQRFVEELNQNQKFKKFLAQYKQSGKAKLVDKEEVEQEIQNIESEYQIKSNDIHILGLAKAGNIKLLCSGDQKLHKDFTKIIREGKVYQYETHKRLLRKDLCP